MGKMRSSEEKNTSSDVTVRDDDDINLNNSPVDSSADIAGIKSNRTSISSGDKQHECIHCRKKFKLLNNLTRHMRVHNPVVRHFAELQQI